MTDQPYASPTLRDPGPTDGRAYVDPDLADDDGPADTALEQLRAELTATITSVTDPYAVPGRPGYSVTYRTDFTGRQLDTYRKRARDRSFTDGVDGVRFASLLLGATAHTIHRHGKPIDLDGDGRPVTFQTRALLELLSAGGVAEAVLKFYGRDADVDAAARALMDEAGWGGDTLEGGEGPTQ